MSDENALATEQTTETTPPLLPARMLNEFTYCPRLAWLEWVQGEFAHSSDTLDGALQHRRVNQPVGHLPPPDTEAVPKHRRSKPQRAEPADANQEPHHEDGDTGAPSDTIHARSIHLSAPQEGLTAIIDLVEDDASLPLTPDAPSPAVLPVDYKRGTLPDLPDRAWEADRVQLCAQGLILRENGYRCSSGVLYYVASKTRVPIAFDEALCTRTRELARQFREHIRRDSMPPPLDGSSKCPRCSLVGICLPDETNLLRRLRQPLQTDTGAQDIRGPGGQAGKPDVPVRPLIPARDDSRALYVQDQGAYVGKKGDCLTVSCRQGLATNGHGQQVAEVRLPELSHVSLFGNVQVSSQALCALLDAQIPVLYFSFGGWFRGMTLGLPSKNIELRRRQFARAECAEDALALSRRLVTAKIENQRTLLRRNGDPPQTALDEMKTLAGRAAHCDSLASLLGLEGNAARLYFQNLPTMLRPRVDANGTQAFIPPSCSKTQCGQDARGTVGQVFQPDTSGSDAPVRLSASPEPAQQVPPDTRRQGIGDPVDQTVKPDVHAANGFSFSFEKRNRRPPADPVNAMLSYAYAILAKDLTIACWMVGLDPFLGFFHQPRFGRPALALDLMEEFRPVIADSVVLTAINTGVVRASDFLRRGSAVALTPDGRKRFLQAYERRMDSLVTHPVFEYQISYRRVLEVQARLLGRWLLGEIAEYPSFLVR